jgi:O-antigen ligase
VTVALIAVAVLAVVSIRFSDVLTQRVTEMILDPGTSSDERRYIWRPVLDKMMGEPLSLITGFGWDSYSAMGFFYAAHNHYLWLWFELGILGVASYVTLIVQLLVTAYRSASQAADETASYLIAFVYGIVGLSVAVFFTQLFTPWLYIWTYSGLMMRMALITRQSVQSHARNERRGAPALASPAAVAHHARARMTASKRIR